MTTTRPHAAGRAGTQSGLLSSSLPQDLLRDLIQSDPEGNKLSPQLRSELKVLARAPNLLVACNYGGTLSPDERTSKVPLQMGNASIALRALASLPNTHAAVISGRSLRDLAAVSRLPAEVHLVGSHGAEFDMDFLYDQPETTTPILREVTDALTEVVRAEKDFRIERIHQKPAGVSVRLSVLRSADCSASASRQQLTRTDTHTFRPKKSGFGRENGSFHSPFRNRI